MPNRILKETICTSDTINELTADEERMFYRLLVQADDFGRFDGRATIIRSSCFPLRVDSVSDADVERWLQRLAEVDLIRFYHVDGRRYLHFTTWDKHQQRRAKHSKYPQPPPQDSTYQHVISDDINGKHPPAYVPEESRIENRGIEKRQTAHARANTTADPAESTPSPVGQSSFVEDDCPDPHDGMTIKDVAERYQRRIGIMSPFMFSGWEEWHTEQGMSYGVMAVAIDETAKAKSEARIRGSPDSYLRGIIRGMHNDGIRTVADIRERARADPRSPGYDTEEALRRRLTEVEALLGEG